MNVHNPVVSIVTVAYNAVTTIENTILSIINQTYPNIEYIIIDGGSTDGTVDIIKKYEDRVSFWLSESDKGIYDAMNKGIDKVSGEWINFMNTGDTFYKETVIEEFVSKVSVDTDIAYGNTMFILSIGQVLERPKELSLINKGMVFGHQATFVRSSLHKKHKFDISFRSSGDYNFFYQMYNAGCCFEYIPLTVVNYDGEQGMSIDNMFTVKREDARIQNKDKNLIWIISFYITVTIYKFKKLLKQILPIQFINYMRIMNLRKKDKFTLNDSN